MAGFSPVHNHMNGRALLVHEEQGSATADTDLEADKTDLGKLLDESDASVTVVPERGVPVRCDALDLASVVKLLHFRCRPDNARPESIQIESSIGRKPRAKRKRRDADAKNAKLVALVRADRRLLERVHVLGLDGALEGLLRAPAFRVPISRTGLSQAVLRG